ncbi:MAG TPA: cytochrome c oxidase subunit II [Chthoniobacterales bacterium]|jgi:cytochrome c oxidase subunit 2|nr:cytochrome c oxidase subunit II [Chthoniobacterales bacterium]
MKDAGFALSLPLLLEAMEMQSALDPAGSGARQVSSLWWLYFWILTAIFVAVLICTCIAIGRARRGPLAIQPNEPPLPESQPTERRVFAVVAACLAMTIAILFALLALDIFTGRSVYALTSEPHPLSLKVIGHQWWWEVHYQDADHPENLMITANEMHIPVGKVVRLELVSTDVIHSFWVPNISGKKDLIPGHPTKTWIKAEKSGTFRGQCAEFCGHQHAHMRLEFVAESPAKFGKWLAQARQNARPPATPSEQRGQRVFLANQCIMCHTIEGTPARATLGPDLTHFGSRTRLAAGSFPNTRGYLAGWIANPQNIKPGVKMPPNTLGPDDLNALVDYLESLK